MLIPEVGVIDAQGTLLVPEVGVVDLPAPSVAEGIPLFVGGQQVTASQWNGMSLSEIWYGGVKQWP